MKKLLLLFLIQFPILAFAQNGIIRGSVIDDQTGEPLFMGTVLLAGTTTGVTTDFDGKFELSVAPGVYTVQFKFVGLTDTEITEVEVKAGEVTVLKEVRMYPKSQLLETFTVAANARRDSETAIMTMKKKSVKMLDGISSKKMELAGDGTAVEAAQRVTGVSIEGGKYVYVRGLGDRYSKVTLNDIRIPGLDPDRNSLQMDLFPTNLISNIVVSKNFTADLPADFTGGLVNIETKAFPDEKILEVSLGVTYNPNMHFNGDYLTYDGGATDFLGFDDGTRALPDNARDPDDFPSILEAEDMYDMTRQFDPQLGAKSATSLMDYSFGVSAGNQKKLGEDYDAPTLGYIFSLNYKQSQTHFDDVTYAEYQRSQDKSEYELIYADIQNGVQSAQSNLIGALGGLAYKTKKDQLKLTVMHIQNGVKRAAILSLDQNTNAVGKSGYLGESDNLVYEQRSITNVLLNGTHNFSPEFELDWKISPTLSLADDPDIRKAAFTFAVDTTFQAGNAGVPLRLWRELTEISVDNQVDITKKFKFKEEDAKLQAGAAFLYKLRNYEINQYSLRFQGPQNWENNDPNEVLLPENLYQRLFGEGTYMTNDNNDPNSNAYEANAMNAAAYVSTELQLTQGLRGIVGVRAEYFNQKHTGRDIAGSSGNIGGNVLENDIVLETFDLFPTINLIQGFNNDINLRFAYARTTARPSFKELSFAQIVDPLTGRTFNGGLFEYPPDWDGNLTSTYIHNVDLRLEKFMDRGQLYSVSLFYKRFIDPIELVRNPLINTSFDIQPRNVGTGQVLGAEFEIRKSLEFISGMLSKYSFSGNVTLVESSIEMTKNEFDGRVANAREDDNGNVVEDVKDTRQMAGQAPYVINAGLEYNGLDNGINAGLFYNVKGPTLLIVGTGFVPDIYQEPFHSLNFGFSKVFGEKKNLKVDFQAANLLGDLREEFFVSYEAKDQIFTQFDPGRSFSLGVSYKF